jgi:hypothetical protein
MSTIYTTYTDAYSAWGYKKGKECCPKCGRKSFNLQTKYGQVIDKSVGYCDHANSCGHSYRAAEYFRRNTNNRFMNEQASFTPPQTRLPSYMDSSLPANYRSNTSSFVQFLLGVFPKDMVYQASEAYKLGSDGYGNVIFWQIDIQNRCRAGKIVSYKPDGHRGKYLNWMHSVLKLKDFNLAQALFGEHLLSMDLKSPICLVESAKSAVIGSVVRPEYLWLSTEGAINWNIEKLSSLRQRRVIVIPDLWNKPPKGKNDWHLLVNVLRSMDIDAYYWDELEQNATSEQREKGWDIADFILERFNY